MLECGKPVLCEKPFCMNKKQLDELINVMKTIFSISIIVSKINIQVFFGL